MRRQVKPFVTEYRGSPRRTKDLHASGDLQHEVQVPRSRSYAEAEKVFQSESSDDSYEAALRAADALFDATPRAAEPARPMAAPSSPEPRKVAPTPFWNPPSEANAGLPDEDDTTAGEFAERDAASSPRRILQAIEPPAEDRFAALEAERAPKKRGRKPGSKNRPKLVVGDDWGATRPPAMPSVTETAAVPVAHAPVRHFAPVLAVLEQAEPIASPDVDDDQPLQQPRGRNDKFGWKRAGLRPGERWKRRLPKAAW